MGFMSSRELDVSSPGKPKMPWVYSSVWTLRKGLCIVIWIPVFIHDISRIPNLNRICSSLVYQLENKRSALMVQNRVFKGTGLTCATYVHTFMHLYLSILTVTKICHIIYSHVLQTGSWLLFATQSRRNSNDLIKPQCMRAWLLYDFSINMLHKT